MMSEASGMVQTEHGNSTEGGGERKEGRSRSQDARSKPEDQEAKGLRGWWGQNG